MFLLLFLPLASAISIHHRLFHPRAPTLEYTLRAHLTSNLTIAQSSSSFSDEISQYLQKLHLNLDLDGVYYQVALQRDGDQSDVQWDVSSVKLCHLYHATSETIILHSKETRVHAIDYFVSPTPHNGACPKRKGKKSRGAQPAAFPKTFNTTIITETYGTPPLPELRTPPALTTEGEPVKLVPEKTFLQKYWMYIVPLLILMLVSGGQEDDQPQRRAQ